MDPVRILKNYYSPASPLFESLLRHGRQVAAKSLLIAKGLRHLNPDLAFVEEAGMLHDIGIFLTRAPEIGCHGERPYICHGILGREILEEEGYPRHAIVCERHVGMGLSREEIERQELPLPRRDMLPISLEEKIICYADKFFSKKGKGGGTEKTIEEVRREIARFGRESLGRFDELTALLGG